MRDRWKVKYSLAITTALKWYRAMVTVTVVEGVLSIALLSSKKENNISLRVCQNPMNVQHKESEA